MHLQRVHLLEIFPLISYKEVEVLLIFEDFSMLKTILIPCNCHHSQGIALVV